MAATASVPCSRVCSRSSWPVIGEVKAMKSLSPSIFLRVLEGSWESMMSLNRFLHSGVWEYVPSEHPPHPGVLPWTAILKSVMDLCLLDFVVDPVVLGSYGIPPTPPPPVPGTGLVGSSSSNNSNSGSDPSCKSSVLAIDASYGSSSGTGNSNAETVSSWDIAGNFHGPPGMAKERVTNSLSTPSLKLSSGQTL